ncbi:hypothetical protein N0V93_001923 [Gnomoniopsis smithogilvyi]|uniref:Uncharacterized protein n=1 Tax=Gnomoniopsis smithogilvyi TaxID=1191159 RepID=A0A9W8Z4S5_9PEZI|nr:hypothetical protein N0V93_001923 [Gnomoniopsis smithogilvyi]
MTVSRNVLSALVAAAATGKVHAAFGPAFSTGPTSSDSYIAESWATLNLPAAPSDNNGDLSLWVGMGTSNGDLIQSIAENYNADDWSVYAYTLISTSDTTQEPIQAEGSTANEGTAVTFHYVYEESTGNYTQEVIVGGTVVSTLSTSDGKAEGWGSAVECAAEDCGTVGAHTWTNVSIILSAADSAYIDTLALGTDVEATMTTSDEGITWEVGTISIPGYSFTTEEVTSSTTTSSSSSAASSGAASSSSGASGASPSGSANAFSSTGSDSAQPSGTSSGSYSGYGGSSTSGSDGAQASGSSSGSYGGYGGSSTSGSDGAQASGSSSGSYGGFGGSSTSGSQGAQASGTSSGSYGGFGGSSTSGSEGSQSSGTPSGSWGGFGGSSTSGSSGAQPSGFSSGGSSTWGSAGSQSSQGAQDSYGFASWRRSRISRHKNN